MSIKFTPGLSHDRQGFVGQHKPDRFVLCTLHGCLLAIILTMGCGGDVPTPRNVNPYANNHAQQSSDTAAPTQGRPAPQRPERSTGQLATDASAAPQSIDVPQASYAAEMGVPLTFLEYITFARKSSEMLSEMTKIHAAVSESGEADPYQERWGTLTAQHTALTRQVMETAYPPIDTARELNNSAIPRLREELKVAQSVMENYDDLEGGLAQPYAQAEQIYSHLTKNLSPQEPDASSISGASNADVDP